jgi:hypothetical protein
LIPDSGDRAALKNASIWQHCFQKFSDVFASASSTSKSGDTSFECAVALNVRTFVMGEHVSTAQLREDPAPILPSDTGVEFNAATETFHALSKVENEMHCAAATVEDASSDAQRRPKPKEVDIFSRRPLAPHRKS